MIVDSMYLLRETLDETILDMLSPPRLVGSLQAGSDVLFSLFLLKRTLFSVVRTKKEKFELAKFISLCSCLLSNAYIGRPY